MPSRIPAKSSRTDTDKEMKAHHVPNVMQMGFQATRGTEMAIAQSVQAFKAPFISTVKGR